MGEENAEIFVFDGLTQMQSKTIPYLVNPEYKTYREVAEAAGVSERAIYKWLNDPDFVKVLNAEIDKYTDGETARVWKSLVREAANGNVQAIKLFFELKGKYKQVHEHTGKDGGPIKYSEMTDEELLEEARKYGLNIEEEGNNSERTS